MVFEMELKKYLLDLGVSKVGFADIDGLASDFLDLPNGISLILKLPKKCVDYIENDEYDKYWMLFHKTMAEITKIALLGEEFIKNKGYKGVQELVLRQPHLFLAGAHADLRLPGCDASHRR